MALDTKGLFDALVSHAMSAGVFDQVNAHEPKSKPGRGIVASIYLDSIVPAKSGLASVSVRITFNIRIQTSMTQEPQDDIDPNILSAVDVLMTLYAGDFSLSDRVRNVDLMEFSARSGYVNQDSTMFRVIVISLPLIVNDVWEEAS